MITKYTPISTDNFLSIAEGIFVKATTTAKAETIEMTIFVHFAGLNIPTIAKAKATRNKAKVIHPSPSLPVAVTFIPMPDADSHGRKVAMMPTTEAIATIIPEISIFLFIIDSLFSVILILLNKNGCVNSVFGAIGV